MSKIFDNLTTEEQGTVKAFATEHKIDFEIAAIVFRSSDKDEERLEALKVLQASAKPKGKALATQERINKLNADYEKIDKKYQEAKAQPVHALGKSLVSYQNDLHKIRMEIKQLEAQL